MPNRAAAGGEHRPPDEVWIGDEAFRLAAENKRLTALVKDAAWQLNEALSMLQEAERDSHKSVPRFGWLDDFREGQAEMQNVLTCLAAGGEL